MSEASEKMQNETGARVLHHKHFRMEDSKISRENPHLCLFAPREFALSMTRAFLGEFYSKNRLFFSLPRHRVAYKSLELLRFDRRLESHDDRDWGVIIIFLIYSTTGKMQIS